MSYTAYEDYLSSPRSADPAELLEEERIRSFELRRLLAMRDSELAERELLINELAGLT